MTQEINFGPVIQKLRVGVCRKESAGGSVVVDIEETEHLMRSTADLLAVVVKLHSAPPVSERERELEGFRKMAESKLNEAMRDDFADAPFPMGPNEAAAYHRTRADLLGWVLDMLPSNEPAITAQPEGEGK